MEEQFHLQTGVDDKHGTGGFELATGIVPPDVACTDRLPITPVMCGRDLALVLSCVPSLPKVLCLQHRYPLPRNSPIEIQ